MEHYLLRKIDIDNLLRSHPDALKIVQDNQITEPVQEAPNLAFRLIPGSERKHMALPQCSLIFGAWDEPWFIDTGLTTEELGAIYIGRSDFTAMASLAGFTEIKNVRDAQNRITELETENERLRNTVAAVSIVRADLDSVQTDLVPATIAGARKRPASEAAHNDSPSAA